MIPTPFLHLIYPVPEKISLGIHLTLEIDHSIKFGPDAEWVDDPYDYSVNENLKSKFIQSINKYLPDITEDMLSPAYAGLPLKSGRALQSMKTFHLTANSNRISPNHHLRARSNA